MPGKNDGIINLNICAYDLLYIYIKWKWILHVRKYLFI